MDAGTGIEIPGLDFKFPKSLDNTANIFQVYMLTIETDPQECNEREIMYDLVDSQVAL